MGQPPPQRLGKYEIVRRLAYGGMGEVLLGRVRGADGFELQVVIKRVLPHLASNAEFIVMFRDEARITARLHHGNIVQVVEFGEVDGGYYLVLEYVDGPSLASLLSAVAKRGQRLSTQEVAHVGTEVARALDYAHRKLGDDGQPLGVVHRDVSPANVLVSREGEVKLADFGIARARQRLAPTQTGGLKGKLAYMPPEVVTGQRADARSDLFALGAVLYEGLAGKSPFQRETDAETVYATLKVDPPPPSSVNPMVPPALDELVLRVLSKDPSLRPARGLEIAEELAVFAIAAARPAAVMLAETVTRLFGRSDEAGGTHERPTVPPPRSRSPALRPCVLVVEESRTLRALVKTSLATHYDVTEAATVEQARAHLAQSVPAVVLCQRVLGGSGGLDLCRWMRGEARLAGVPFVLLTGDDGPEVRVAATEAGAQAVLPKKLDRSLLIETLRSVVGS